MTKTKKNGTMIGVVGDEAPVDFLRIESGQREIVFKIDYAGKVWWLRGGKLVEAKTDKQLSLALGKAFSTLASHNEHLRKTIKELDKAKQ